MNTNSNNLSDKPVLVLITALDCTHCKNLALRWDEIERTLNASGAVKVVKVSVPTTKATSVDLTKYPRALNGCLRWYPILLLLTADSWNQANSDSKNSVQLEGAVFNGAFSSSGVPQLQEAKYSMVKDDILRWVNDSLKNKVFQKGKTFPGSGSTSKTVTQVLPQGLALNTSGTSVGASSASQSGRGANFVPTTGARTGVCSMKIVPRNR